MRTKKLKDFLKKNLLKDDTMIETDLQRVSNFNVYPRVSKVFSDKGFVSIGNGSQGGADWTAFYAKLTNHSSSTRLVDSQINFYLTNYPNQ